MGTGRACFETLRPLAYSLLAELVHHVRGDLSLSQVAIVLRPDVMSCCILTFPIGQACCHLCEL